MPALAMALCSGSRDRTALPARLLNGSELAAERRAQQIWRMLELAAHEARRMEGAEAKEGGTQSGVTQ